MDCRAHPELVLLALANASVRLGHRRFGPFTLSVRAGERIAILGPSGAGKSTLLRMMARELLTAGGEALLRDRRLQDWSLSELSRQRAMLPQSHEVAFGLPTELVIGLGRVARVHDPRLDAIVRLAARLACATHLLGRRFDTLSGGEKARVQLARVFAQLWDVEQALLLVDEPLAALDPGLQFQLLDAIEQFASERGHAVLAVLHDVNHALLGFERLLLVKQGALVGDLPGTPAAIPQLGSLYGIEFTQAISDSGEVIAAPVRAQKPPEVAVSGGGDSQTTSAAAELPCA